jgi:hypothetical protein
MYIIKLALAIAKRTLKPRRAGAPSEGEFRALAQLFAFAAGAKGGAQGGFRRRWRLAVGTRRGSFETEKWANTMVQIRDPYRPASTPPWSQGTARAGK